MNANPTVLRFFRKFWGTPHNLQKMIHTIANP